MVTFHCKMLGPSYLLRLRLLVCFSIASNHEMVVPVDGRSCFTPLLFGLLFHKTQLYHLFC